MKACFFVKIRDKSAIRHTEFYAQDIRVLEELGFDVDIATGVSELTKADLYFVWWWTWAFVPVTFARLVGRPVLITGTFDHMYAPGDWGIDRRPRWQRALMVYGLRHADANVFVSQLEHSEVSRRFRPASPSYSPHSVDTNLYRPATGEREDFVLTIAWMHASNANRKCIPEIIRAAPLVHRAHPDVRFVIAGERASGYPALQRLAGELGASGYIEFPGIITRERKIDLMQRCRTYLQPTRSEGFGLATLEAMSCAAPVVTSPQGAVPEVVGDAAVMVDGASPEAIADGVIRLLDDREAARVLGQAGRVRAETVFPYERRKRDLERVISQLLGANDVPAVQRR